MNEIEFFVIPLISGFILDLLLGDPKWLPHPIRLFGVIIAFCEHKLNRGKYRIIKGALIALLLPGFIWLVLFLVSSWLCSFPYLFCSISTILIFYGLANRSLISEALKVNSKLENDGIDAARKQLSFIVGRDTSELSPNQIRIAVLETVSENLSDGVIAPLFWYGLGGLPAMFAYKMVNTLDSMIGYKNERFKQFGLFAARIDDVANIIPARITALLMVLIAFSWRGGYFVLKFGHKHKSPNSGYPEAALAGILNCRFGGPNVYHGKLVDKPFIGVNNRIITNTDVQKAIMINLSVSLMMMVILLAWFLFR
jgi:adenosylcobinamide-phosphate synthase